MNVLLKREVCGSHKQYTGSTGKAEMHFFKKKKKKVKRWTQCYPNTHLMLKHHYYLNFFFLFIVVFHYLSTFFFLDEFLIHL